MSRFQLEYTPRAKRDIAKLPLSPSKVRLEAKIASLADNPCPPKCVKIQGTRDQWRIKGNDLRVRYSVDSKQLVVTVLEAACGKASTERLRRRSRI